MLWSSNLAPPIQDSVNANVIERQGATFCAAIIDLSGLNRLYTAFRISGSGPGAFTHARLLGCRRIGLYVDAVMIVWSSML
jgi:hypothetical protein